MPTLRSFVKLAAISVKDKTSGTRARQIARILRKYRVTHGVAPERLVKLLEELGPTFVKMGQVASNRNDMLPQRYCDALHGLRAHVSPMPFEEVTRIIEESYGRPAHEVFASLEPEPLGSASIAQVHKATLPGGEVVAVKVRRPGIAEQMAEDIMLLRHILTLAEFSVPEDSDGALLGSAAGLLDELERTTMDELDFSVETANLVRFRAITDRQAGVTSPLPHPELTTPDVLVMEFVQGSSITDVADEGERARLGELLAKSYVAQVMDEGFFHADPHPGNIIVRDGELVWIDLGMTGQLGTGERTLVAQLFTAIASMDAIALTNALAALAGGAEGVTNYALLLRQVTGMLSRYASADLASIDVGAAFSEITEMMRAQGLTLPPSVTMLGRGFLTLEGVVSEVAPDTNVVGILEEHVKRQLASVSTMRDKASKVMVDAAMSMAASARVPKQVSDTLDMLERGQLRMGTDLRFSREFRTMIYTVAGLLAVSLISAGLFVGSSILCTTDMAPKLFGVPVLGVLGYLGAAVLGVYAVWLAWRMRHKALRNDA